MSACDFNIPFSGSAESIYLKAKKAVESQNGSFNGDSTGGDFEVNVFGNKIAGSYTVSGQSLNLTIHSKPFMIPCSMIEGMLVKQLS